MTHYDAFRHRTATLIPPIAMHSDPASIDPYAPPTTDVEVPLYQGGPEAPLADRGARLGASILDNLVIMAVAIPIGMVYGFRSEDEPLGAVPLATLIALGALILLVVVVNLRLIAREGQTLGKKWSKIRIVRSDGSKASFGRIFGIRMLFTGALGAIPVVGPLFSVADILFIFGEERKCLHDRLADTKVVQA